MLSLFSLSVNIVEMSSSWGDNTPQVGFLPSSSFPEGQHTFMSMRDMVYGERFPDRSRPREKADSSFNGHI